MKISSLLPSLLRGCFFFAIIPIQISYGQDSKPPVPAQAAGAQAGEIQALLDPFFAERMTQRHIAGAVVVMVRDGQVLFSKGYGYADLDRRIPFNPDTTIFRAGSISKLFTATAVMQLVERNLLNLDENVNSYLKHFQLKDLFPQPVTLGHLLTHTAGFAEYIHRQHRLVESDWQPLAEYLTERMPPRVLPPGRFFSYNDHGFSLAGLIVEEVSGISFPGYVAQNIFNPLGMDRSTFRQRPAPELMKDLAVGYLFKDGANVPYTLDYVETVPAAGLFTTGRDISRFMMAHLQTGRLGEIRILGENATREMHSRHFIHHEKLRGRAYGFSELFINGQRIIFHDGGMPGYTSRLCLLPESGIGFFVSCTSDDLGTKAILTTKLMDRLFPPDGKPAPAKPAPQTVKVSEFLGYYDQVAGFATNGLRLGSMLQNYAVVKAGASDRISVFGGEYAAVEPLVFQDRGGNYVAFGRDEDQEIRYLYAGSGVYERLGRLENPTALLYLAVIFVMASMPMGVLWPAGALVWPGRFRSSWTRQFPSGRTLAAVVSFLTVFFLAGFVGLFMQLENYWQIMRNEYPWSWVTRLLAVPLVIAVLTPVLFLYSARAWKTNEGTVFGRVYMSLFTAVTLFFLWTLGQWHLIGFNY